MKLNKYNFMFIMCIGLAMSACGEDENIKVDGEENDKNKITVVSDKVDKVEKVEKVVDPFPNNALSAEVDIEMIDLNFILVDFQLNINEYFYDIVNSNLEDYQKKALIDSGEMVNEKIKSIKLDAMSEGDKEILYLYEELKKYHELRFNALKKHLDTPNDADFKIFNENSILVSDIAMKMIDIRAKDL